MEKSTNYSFNLPNSANDEIADINDISDNFRIIDEKLKIDQTFLGTSENPQSGKAIAGEIGKKQDYFADVNNDSQNRDINLTDKNGNVVGQIVVVPTEGIRYTNVLTPENDTHGVNKKYVDDTTNNVKSYVNNNFANALKGSASGEAVRLSDIAPNEHTLGVKVSGRNLFDKDNANIIIGYPDAENVINGASSTRSVYIPCAPNATYTVSKTLTARFAVAFTDDIPSIGVAVTGRVQNNTASSITTTSGINSRYIVVWLYHVDLDTTTIKINEVLTTLQIELGSTATSYTPYITDFSGVTLKRYGKNLLPYPYKNTNIDYTFNGINYKVKSDGTIVLNGTANEQSYFILGGLVLNKGVYYLSGCPSGGQGPTYSIYFQYDNFSYYKADYGSGVKININEKKNCAVAITIGKNTAVSNLIFKPMLEVGSKLTDFEERRTAVAYTPAADGTVTGVTSLYPTTTLMTDTASVIINAEYNRDINKAFAELQQAILSMGGNT